MQKDFVENLWNLSREIYPEKFDLDIANSAILIQNDGCFLPCLIANGNRMIGALQSHSERSAWVSHLWSDGKSWFPGVEYKGVGYKGKPIEIFKDETGNFEIAWGACDQDFAIAEYRLSKVAYNAGVNCQKPLLIYDVSSILNRKCAVLVRTVVSPIRLSDFMLNNNLFKKYLEIKNQNEVEFVENLGLVVGRSVKRLFNCGLVHCSLGINNLTTEGELVDFEPTYGGTWEGVLESKEPKWQVLSLFRLFFGVSKMWPNFTTEFIDNFTVGFFGNKVEVNYEESPKEIIESYIERKLPEGELKIEFGNTREKILDVAPTLGNDSESILQWLK